MLNVELPGRRTRGRLQRRFMNVVKEDMKRTDVTEERNQKHQNTTNCILMLLQYCFLFHYLKKKRHVSLAPLN